MPVEPKWKYGEYGGAGNPPLAMPMLYFKADNQKEWWACHDFLMKIAGVYPNISWRQASPVAPYQLNGRLETNYGYAVTVAVWPHKRKWYIPDTGQKGADWESLKSTLEKKIKFHPAEEEE